jgi:hypothetical protein
MTLMIGQLNKTTLMIAGVVTAALLLGLVGALPAFSQIDNGEAQTAVMNSVQSAVSETISYQGRLTDSDGEPLTGQFTMRFWLYNVPAGGTPLFDSGNQPVAVADGLFTVSLAVGQDRFDGQPLWLRIDVGGQTLAPRQEIKPAPYAMSLRPGAEIRQVATGTAVRVESTQGIGLQGTGRVYGVYGRTSGAPQGAGYGGYFESASGIGVHGRSTAMSSGTNLLAPGVSGYSQHGVGILGQAATGFGVYGTSAGNGIGGIGQAYGVFGASAAPAQGSGYGGYFVSSTGIGVSGRSTAVSTGNNLYAPGVYGFSQNGAGVVGQSGAGVGVLVIGNLVATGSKAGYVVDIARNDGDKPLHQGDLVIVTGVTDPVVGNIPVPLVRQADSEASTAVIGVVDELYQPGENEVGRFAAGLINPGDYLTIVTLGAYMVINVDASYGAIQPGDLLVSSPTPGHAMRANNPALGTVIGKALSGLESGAGTVAIMVTLQ